MADIRGVVLYKILSKEDGYLDAWSNLKLSYFGTEYAPIYRAISKFYVNHGELPKFEDLELTNRNPILEVSLAALKVSDPLDVSLDLAVEALINEYTQEEVLKDIDSFLDQITLLEANEIKSELGNILLNIEEKTLSSADVVMMNDIEFMDDPELLNLMPLGLSNYFDSEQGGMALTEVLGLGGYRGTGKSNVCCNLSTSQYETGNCSIYFTIEMRAREIFNRKLALLSGVNLTNINLARLTFPDLQKIARVRTDMFLDGEEVYQGYLGHKNYKKFERELISSKLLKPDNQMVIVDNQRLTLPNIDLTVHKYKAKFGDKLKMVVVDYLNQIEMKDKYDWKNQIEMSAQLKAIARKHEIVLVTPYQVDKTGEARFSKGILDSMDIAMTLEKEPGIIHFKSTKTRGKTEFKFSSAMSESNLRIDPSEVIIPKEEETPDKETKKKPKDLPW